MNGYSYGSKSISSSISVGMGIVVRFRVHLKTCKYQKHTDLPYSDQAFQRPRPLCSFRQFRFSHFVVFSSFSRGIWIGPEDRDSTLSISFQLKMFSLQQIAVLKFPVVIMYSGESCCTAQELGSATSLKLFSWECLNTPAVWFWGEWPSSLRFLKKSPRHTPAQV